MKPFQIIIDDELFRISERAQPDGSLSYDAAWLNGSADGTYGFTVARHAVGPQEHVPGDAARMTEEELVDEVRGFIRGFHGPAVSRRRTPPAGP